MKTFTDLEQSKKLAEFLPVKSADLCYLAIDKRGVEYIEKPSVIDGTLEETDVPCWSLAALLAVVPKEHYLSVDYLYTDDKGDEHWSISSNENMVRCSHFGSNSIDAAVELILELKEKNII